MAIIYKSRQSNFPDKEGRKLFYPLAVTADTVSTNELAAEVAGYSSLTTGDVKNTLDNLVTVMTAHLQASQSVTLDGLGTFRITMKAKPGRGVETDAEVSHTQSVPRVHFQPATTRDADGNATRALLDGAKFVRFAAGKMNAAKPGTGGGSGGDDKPGHLE
ncbi:MAG: HU family DNA-binding protein [Prevotellaceae bacterium]|jgi:predicted histone-like DNA-binding protein|nr:HU family DNA-binding protein [Prevotellaceae bacterium]